MNTISLTSKVSKFFEGVRAEYNHYYFKKIRQGMDFNRILFKTTEIKRCAVLSNYDNLQHLNKKDFYFFSAEIHEGISLGCYDEFDDYGRHFYSGLRRSKYFNITHLTTEQLEALERLLDGNIPS